MKKFLIPCVVFSTIFLIIFCSFSQQLAASQKQLVIRQAQEDSKGAVAVEAYLDGNTLEAKVSARMTKGRPSIENVVLMGPAIGRIVPATVKQLYATSEEEPPYETVQRKGFISFRKGQTTKRIKGGVTRKLVTFVLPEEQIKKGKDYYIRVKINSAKQTAGSPGKSTKFDFDVSKIAKMIAQ